MAATLTIVKLLARDVQTLGDKETLSKSSRERFTLRVIAVFPQSILALDDHIFEVTRVFEIGLSQTSVNSQRGGRRREYPYCTVCDSCNKKRPLKSPLLSLRKQ